MTLYERIMKCAALNLEQLKRGTSAKALGHEHEHSRLRPLIEALADVAEKVDRWISTANAFRNSDDYDDIDVVGNWRQVELALARLEAEIERMEK